MCYMREFEAPFCVLMLKETNSDSEQTEFFKQSLLRIKFGNEAALQDVP